MFLFAGHGNKFHLRKQQGGQGLTVRGTGINADFVFLDKWFFKDGVPKNNRFAEIIGRVNKFVPDPEAPITGLPAEMKTGLQAGMNIDAMPIFP